MDIISPAKFVFLGVKTQTFSILIPATALVVFIFILKKRIAPLCHANRDQRFNQIGKRLVKIWSLWFLQIKQPRYKTAGCLHMAIFFGFLILLLRSLALVFIGFQEDFQWPFLNGSPGIWYAFCKDYASTVVLIACILAAIRRGIIKPTRYAVPKQYGSNHTSEAIFVLAIISVLMISESLFEASQITGLKSSEYFIAPFSLVAFFTEMLQGSSHKVLQNIHILAYYIHDILFFFFLCYLPFGKHFHVLTSFFNVFFMRLDKGTVKPVRYGLKEEQLDSLDSFGIKNLKDFTWKHLLDFYSCADCGRCSDQCPANTVHRPLSPRFLTLKARDTLFKAFPIWGTPQEVPALVGSIYSVDEIWSCTTCGACEEECPLAIEYIDKIVDLRRGMIDTGMVPQSLQKPLNALEKRGNPYGKSAKQRGKWITEETFAAMVPVKQLKQGETVETLFFVDSVGSYDDRIIEVNRKVALLLEYLGKDFGILGEYEKDAGNEIKRFGEEMLFQDIKKHNTKMILAAQPHEIVTADPHTFNTLTKDYDKLPPVKHISQILLAGVRQGAFTFKPSKESGFVYTYHDPCYLGRHNLLYDEPRQLLDALPGMNRVEMERSRDRSFCCSGGGLALFYEPEEETRMGVVRVRMARKAGANVLVTACPFCLINMEDAVKSSGLEKELKIIDLTELFLEHLVFP